jgi:hypothetical protein
MSGARHRRKGNRVEREPFTILVPLLRLEIERSGGGAVCNGPIPDSPVVDGLLFCAIDEHTRPGKQAINRLVAEDTPLDAETSKRSPSGM